MFIFIITNICTFTIQKVIRRWYWRRGRKGYYKGLEQPDDDESIAELYAESAEYGL